MPENARPPKDDQPQKPADEEEKISRVGEAIECQHPDCRKPALSLSSYCWKHTEDKEGYQRKIHEWYLEFKSMKGFILFGADLSGLYLVETDLSMARLRRANLSGASLEGANLSGARLHYANLSNAWLEGADMSDAWIEEANLSGAWLMGANLSGAMLEGANMSGTVLELADLSNARLGFADLSEAKLDGANLSGAFLNGANLSGALLVKADLSRALLREADLSDAELTGANLSEALLIEAKLTKAYLNWAKLTDALDLTRKNFSKELTEEEKKDSEHYKESYLTVKNYFIQNGRYDDASWAAFRERTLERIGWYNKTKLVEIKDLLSLWKWKSAFRWFGSKVMSLLNGYGEIPWRVFASSGVIVIGFFIIYFRFKWIQAYPEEVLHWWDYLYFSIVTFTTLGYGDLQPLAVPGARLVASGEAFIGAFMIALFVWTLARRYVAR